MKPAQATEKPGGSLKLRRTARGVVTLRATGQLADRLVDALKKAAGGELERLRTTVRFVDEGQDALEWDLDGQQLVIDCRPHQRDVWKGVRVVGDIRPGQRLRIVRDSTGRTAEFLHPVEEVVHGLRP